MFKALTLEEVKALNGGDHYMTVTKGMSGHFAVEMWINNEEPYLGPFPEPFNTGFGRYLYRMFAEGEAIAMAKEMNLPYYFPPEN